MVAPKLRKAGFIDQLADFARSSGLLVDVCTLSVKELKLSRECLHRTILQYDSKAVKKSKKEQKLMQTFVMMGLSKCLIAMLGPLIAMLKWWTTRAAVAQRERCTGRCIRHGCKKRGCFVGQCCQKRFRSS